MKYIVKPGHNTAVRQGHKARGTNSKQTVELKQNNAEYREAMPVLDSLSYSYDVSRSS